MAEIEVATFLTLGALTFVRNFFGRQLVDGGDGHADQALERMTVIGCGGGVGVNDQAIGRIDQQQHRLVFLEQVAKTLFAGHQLLPVRFGVSAGDTHLL